jgi:hypothetical protein
MLRTMLHDLYLGNLRFSIAFGISAVNAAEIQVYLPLLPPVPIIGVGTTLDLSMAVGAVSAVA